MAEEAQPQPHHHHHHLPPEPSPPPQAQILLPPQKPKPKPEPEPMAKSPPSSQSPRAAFCTFLTVFLLLAGITLLVLWLVYRPYKPRLTVVGAAVYGLNATAAPASLLSATLQFTILVRNPNRRVNIYYDRLSAFVSYRNEAITAPMMLPPLYLERHSTVSVSPMLGGTAVPVSVQVTEGLAADEGYGVVGLRVVVLGRLRWKAGAIRTGHYQMYAKCDVLMGLKNGFVGQVPLLRAPACHVDI